MSKPTASAPRWRRTRSARINWVAVSCKTAVSCCGTRTNAENRNSKQHSTVGDQRFYDTRKIYARRTYCGTFRSISWWINEIDWLRWTTRHGNSFKHQSKDAFRSRLASAFRLHWRHCLQVGLEFFTLFKREFYISTEINCASFSSLFHNNAAPPTNNIYRFYVAQQ